VLNILSPIYDLQYNRNQNKLEATIQLEIAFTMCHYLLQNADEFRESPVELVEHGVDELGSSFQL